MLIVSKKAEIYISKLLIKEKKDTHLKIFVLHPETYKSECGISYFLLNERTINDIQLYNSTFSIYTDQKNTKYLKNAKIDLALKNFQYELTLDAPNIKIRPPNKKSSLIEKVRYFLYSKINFELSKHGGKISLVKITKKGFVYLKFSGGCNGCSMSNVTLKQGIEKKLLQEFSELSGVIDVTNHTHGTHSYY